MTRATPLLALLLLAPTACGSDPVAGAPDAGPGDPGLVAPPEGEGLQLRLATRAAAGAEIVACREFVIPDGGEVSRFEHDLGDGGHHIILYRTSLSPEEVTDDVFDCGEIAGPLTYASQFQREEFAYPAGVGMRFSPGEVVRVEVHRVNTSDAELEGEVHLNLWFADEPLDAEAGSLFLYHRDIAIPPGATATARMHCAIPEDIELHFLTPHTHNRGTRFRVWLRGDEGASELVLDAAGYADRETRALTPPLAVRAGQSLDVECEYRNETGDWIIEGPSGVEDEMCLLLGQYHPRLPAAAEWCTMAGSGPVHDGTLSCGEALGCVAGAADEVAAERCFVDVCSGSSAPMADFTNCAFNHCQQACPGPDCFACAAASCQPELGACQASACD